MILPSLEAWMPKNCPPDCECSARSFVEMSKAREVNAFLIEMSMLPSHAPSILTCETRLPPASHTAMFIGWLICAAFFSAAAMIRRASSSFTDIVRTPFVSRFAAAFVGTQIDPELSSPAAKPGQTPTSAVSPLYGGGSNDARK